MAVTVSINITFGLMLQYNVGKTFMLTDGIPDLNCL